MEKQKKRFSRQSTAEMTHTPTTNPVSKQYKIQRKPSNSRPINQVLKPKTPVHLNPFKLQQSTLSHLTKRSLFDRKSSRQSQYRPKSLALAYKGKYKQPGVFNIQDKMLLDLYKNDPFARQKIDYVIRKTEQKLQKNKALAATVYAKINSKVHENISMDSNQVQRQQINKDKTFVRCKSQSDLIQAQQCLRYKQLIVTNSQAYSGVST